MGLDPWVMSLVSSRRHPTENAAPLRCSLALELSMFFERASHGASATPPSWFSLSQWTWIDICGTTDESKKLCKLKNMLFSHYSTSASFCPCRCSLHFWAQLRLMSLTSTIPPAEHLWCCPGLGSSYIVTMYHQNNTSCFAYFHICAVVKHDINATAMFIHDTIEIQT